MLCFLGVYEPRTLGHNSCSTSFFCTSHMQCAYVARKCKAHKIFPDRLYVAHMDRTHQVHLLAGFVRCAKCGRIMSRKTNRHSYGTYHYYRCVTNNRMKPGGCTRGSIRIDKIEEAVLLLLQKTVEFKDLGLLIVDEEQRFGVAQKERLKELYPSVDVLTLSATPIPRTLALVLYNDLDLSVINELPPRRQKVTTAVISSKREDAMFKYIADCANNNVQSYVVCPLVERNDDIAARSAQEMYAFLQSLIGDKVALVHGKMSGADKKTVMNAFASGEIQVLVATTVIEVGVNVPNAVNMVIVDADRFGLSQLHQLRGRVGRGTKKSYCFLLSDVDCERLEVMEKSDNGFEIAEKDLALRGPGDYFGLRQSGMPATDFSALFADMELVSRVQEALKELKCNPHYENIERSLYATAKKRCQDIADKITYN